MDEFDDSLLVTIWQQLARQYFPAQTKLMAYEIDWSKRRQTRTLAVCYMQKKRVRVARELNVTAHQVWLKPLLFHEMCHAVLEDNVSQDGRGRAWHGPEFKALERLHPLTSYFKAWVDAGGWAHAVRQDRTNRARRHIFERG